MGWLFPHVANRRNLIEERTKGWEKTTGDLTVKSDCVKHCFRGGHFTGVLWTVWKQTFTKEGADVRPEQRFIGCDLLEYSKRHQAWGFKDRDWLRSQDPSEGFFKKSCASAGSSNSRTAPMEIVCKSQRHDDSVLNHWCAIWTMCLAPNIDPGLAPP